MSYETALRATELLLALAFLQSSAEHLITPGNPRWLLAPRTVLSGILALGLAVPWALLGLSLHSLWLLHRFAGPYNGGSDRMGLLVLYCLTLAHWLPRELGEFALGYLGLQLVLSYFVSGRVKLVNPDWRSGDALSDVFAFSAYPVSEGLRDLAAHRNLLWVGSWAVILLEFLFPLSLLKTEALVFALGLTAVFHAANAYLFGLNRFFWAWIAGYPALIWLQGRLEYALWG